MNISLEAQDAHRDDRQSKPRQNRDEQHPEIFFADVHGDAFSLQKCSTQQCPVLDLAN